MIHLSKKKQASKSKSNKHLNAKKNHEADYVAIVRSIMFLTYLVTNIFIVAGVVRHWNDEPVEIYIERKNDLPRS